MVTADDLWTVVETTRLTSPIIHNLTNDVVVADTAQAIHSAGGVQASQRAVEEAKELATHAAAIVVNVGTPNEQWVKAVRLALAVAQEMEKPWILDPVAVGFLEYRTTLCQEFLTCGPSVIKGNASEILALSGQDAPSKAAESSHTTQQASGAANALAKRVSCVVAISGEIDLITDGQQSIQIANGHPLMPQVIGSGCMLSSILGAYLGSGRPALEATMAGMAAWAIAGELAGEISMGPQSMRTNLLDAFAGLDEATFLRRIKIL